MENKEKEIALHLVTKELNRATNMYAPMNSPHEGIAILGEEFFELWQEVIKSPKKRDRQAMTEEAVQTAAMAIRFIIDVCLKETCPYCNGPVPCLTCSSD